MCYIGGLNRTSFRITSCKGLRWLEYPALARGGWLLHAFSLATTARGGELDLARAQDATRLNKSRREWLEALGARESKLAEIHQIHSTVCFAVSHGVRGGLEFRPAGYVEAARGEAPCGDVLLTDQPGILLGVRVADCAPILLADPLRHAVVAAHMGWRGALKGVAEVAVGEMRLLFGSRPADILALVGPSIRSCCYEVGPEVVDAFCGAFPDGEKFFVWPKEAYEPRHPFVMSFLSSDPPGHAREAPRPRLDLIAVARYQLEKAGLSRGKVAVADFCTACRTDLFYSHRRQGVRAGRMMAVIGIRPEGEPHRQGSVARKRP